MFFDAGRIIVALQIERCFKMVIPMALSVRAVEDSMTVVAVRRAERFVMFSFCLLRFFDVHSKQQVSANHLGVSSREQKFWRRELAVCLAKLGVAEVLTLFIFLLVLRRRVLIAAFVLLGLMAR